MHKFFLLEMIFYSLTIHIVKVELMVNLSTTQPHSKGKRNNEAFLHLYEVFHVQSQCCIDNSEQLWNTFLEYIYSLFEIPINSILIISLAKDHELNLSIHVLIIRFNKIQDFKEWFSILYSYIFQGNLRMIFSIW